MRENGCRYFRSPIHHESCHAGINYLQLAGGERFGYLARIPCSGAVKPEDAVKCAMIDRYTDEEEKAIYDEIQKRSELTMKAYAEIRAAKKQSGFIECPKCNGKLFYAVAQSNKHVHAKCETEGCLQWME